MNDLRKQQGAIAVCLGNAIQRAADFINEHKDGRWLQVGGEREYALITAVWYTEPSVSYARYGWCDDVRGYDWLENCNSRLDDFLQTYVCHPPETPLP